MMRPEPNNDNTVNRAIHSYLRTDRLHRKLFENIVGKTGMHRSQHMMLMHISGSEVTGSQKQLAEEFEISAAAVASSLAKLEANGLICRVTSQTDSRNNEIRITEAGRKIVEKTHSIFSAVDNRMFDGFSQAELGEFIVFTDRISENLKSMCLENNIRVTEKKCRGKSNETME